MKKYKQILAGLLAMNLAVYVMPTGMVQISASAQNHNEKLTDTESAETNPQDAQEEAISYVKSYHYIDDRQYAMDYIEYHQESKTKQKLLQSLMSKGLSKELILECFDEIVGDRKKELEEEQILKILRKKNYDPEQWTFEEKQRLMASLYRKGFSSELIHVHFYLT